MPIEYPEAMRTTLNLDDELMRRLKHLAVDSGRTLTDLVQDTLRRALTVNATPRRAAPFRVITSPGRLIARVDLTRTGRMLTHLDRGGLAKLHGAPTIHKSGRGKGRGARLVARLRGAGGAGPTTDQVMALTRD